MSPALNPCGFNYNNLKLLRSSKRNTSLKLSINCHPPSPNSVKHRTRQPRKWFSTVIVLLAGALVWMLMGCASQPMRYAIPEPELLVPCPELTVLTDGSAGAVLFAIADTAAQYYECAARLDALIEAVSRLD